jgi:hypothetical protein
VQTQSYGASVTAIGSRGQVTAIWSKRQFLPDVPGYNNPAERRPRTERLDRPRTRRAANGSATSPFRRTCKGRTLLDWRTGVSYAAQCCGVSVDYQVVNVAPYGVGIQTDHRFNFSFTLAGIGTFSNPWGPLGDNVGR